jgi:YbgC/YbaW family acyl-CoA thioester hydrolase
MFEQKTAILMGQVDAAGVVFGPRLLEMAHAAYEAFLFENGWSVQRILDEGWALPIVHLEADFSGPLRLGDLVTVQLSVERLGGSSFTLGYAFVKQGQVAASARSVHVALIAGDKSPLPDDFRQILSPHA